MKKFTNLSQNYRKKRLNYFTILDLAKKLSIGSERNLEKKFMKSLKIIEHREKMTNKMNVKTILKTLTISDTELNVIESPEIIFV